MKNQKKLNEDIHTGTYTAEDLERLDKLNKDNKYALGLVVQPKDLNNTAFAWDSVYKVEGDKVIITGYVAPGGPESGNVTIETSLTNFGKYYKITCDPDAADELPNEEDQEFVRSICEPY